MYAIVILGMVYGLRRSEMCGLRWKDIDFENGYIHVCNTVVKGKSGHIEEESTKTEKSNRYLPLIGFTIPYFRDLLQQQISSGSKCDKVCQLSDGSPVLPDYITHKYKEFLAAHNLPDIRVHDMRHPYVKHTTKKYNSEKQKTQATKIDLIAWVFRFCIFNYSKRSWTL